MAFEILPESVTHGKNFKLLILKTICHGIKDHEMGSNDLIARLHNERKLPFD